MIDDSLQSPALALNNASEEVKQYLSSVKEEASKLVYYDELVNEKEDMVDVIPTPALLISSWSQSVIDELLRLKDEVDADDKIDSVTEPATSAAWRKLMLETSPTFSFINSLSPSTRFKLVVYSTKWISSNIPACLSKWIWYLFVRIPNTLDANEVSVMRDLGKKAVKLNDVESLSEVTRFSVEMIVLVVGVYYGQRDLLDGMKKVD